jgi:nicotinate-nucleotide adenylyltransferase
MKHHIGIYPGTFDPIHPGHIAFATKTMLTCRLDEVVFLPERKPRGKHDVTEIAQRIALIENTITTESNLKVANLTLEQFTIKDTLPELHGMFPEAAFTLLVGSDIVRTFLYRWKDLGTLLNETSLAIGMRANDTQDEMTEIIDELESRYHLLIHYSFIRASGADITSSQIRNNNTELSVT